jgi:hypothetical protein
MIDCDGTDMVCRISHERIFCRLEVVMTGTAEQIAGIIRAGRNRKFLWPLAGKDSSLGGRVEYPLERDGSQQLDLRKQVTISPPAEGQSASGLHIDRPQEMSLFKAIRRWTNDEGVPFDIEVDGNRLTREQIQEIAHSEPYKELLLAFDERR